LKPLAFALEAAVDFAEVDGIKLNGTSYAYWRYREAGFAGFTESTDSTVEQFGGGIDLSLTRALSLAVLIIKLMRIAKSMSLVRSALRVIIPAQQTVLVWAAKRV